MTALLEQERIVNCYTCGNPTGKIAPGGQCDFPVCGPCTNLHLPDGRLVNVPGNPRSFYCYDTYSRDDRIKRRGGVVPVLPNDAFGGRSPDVDGEGGGFQCDCGGTRFRLVELVRTYRYHVFCEQTDYEEAPGNEPWVVYDTDWEDDAGVDDSWAECENCGEQHLHFTTY